jgi:type I restriction enzyme, S subunit
MQSDEMPTGWKLVRLGQHAHRPEYGYTASAVTEPVGPKLLRITDIQDHGVDWETVPYCNCDETAVKRYLLRPGDLIIARIGATTGKAHLISECPEVIFASYLIRIRPKADLAPEFLYYFLQSERYWNQIERSKGGRLKGGVNIPILDGLELPLPPLTEQRAIARILRAVQAAREARQREVSLERERKAALMAHLFTRGIRGEPTKQTPIGEMPASWELVTLGDAIMLQRGFDLPAQDRKPGPFPVVSSSGFFASHVEPKVAGPGVVTGRYGTIGQVFYIESDFWPLNTTLFVKEFKGNDPLFISYFLQTMNLHLLNDKTSVPGINRNAAHALPVGLPSLSEQRDIAKVLRVCDAKIAALERESALLDELFRALLDELMTGRVSVAGMEVGNG